MSILDIIKKEDDFRETIRIRDHRRELAKKIKSEHEQNLDKLIELAKGFVGLFQDHRHRSFIEFIKRLRTEYMRDLRTISSNSRNFEERSLVAARISAKLDLLDRLENEPDSLVKELKRTNRLKA